MRIVYWGNVFKYCDIRFFFLFMFFVQGWKTWVELRVQTEADRPEMDQDYERRLLRQINHQNVPDGHVSKVRNKSIIFLIWYRLL